MNYITLFEAEMDTYKLGQILPTHSALQLTLEHTPLFTTVRPEDGQARPKHVVTFDNKIQNQDSCVFRQTPLPSFDVHKHNGDDEPEDKPERTDR
jgi:hypothetical protein